MSAAVQLSGRVIDGPQFAKWSEKIFRQMRDGGVAVVHVTVAYHENFRDTVDLIAEWNQRFRQHRELIGFAGSREEIDAVVASGRTAIVFGLQNPSPIEADLRLLEVLHSLGIRVMQLSYNNQSLLCAGWTERDDSGLTNMGREVIREMNRLGMAVDMSHSAERSTLEAIEVSERPLTISHANPFAWKATLRNKSDRVIDALAANGGMLGLSLYAGHLRDGAETTLQSFCTMAARLADRIGVDHIALGSDLCQDQPASMLTWMREGRWKEGSAQQAPFPNQPGWFNSNLDFANIRGGFAEAGFSAEEVEKLMWRNWYGFFADAFRPVVDCVADGKAPSQPELRMIG